MYETSKRKDLQLSTYTDTREPSNENINIEKERKKILKERVRREMREIIRRNRRREREK